MKSIIWTSKPLSRALRGLLSDPVIVGSLREFLDAPRDAKTVSFVDDGALEHIERLAKELATPADQMTPPESRRLLAAVSTGPVVMITDSPVATALSWWPRHPWLSHAVGASLLEHPIATSHLKNLLATFGAVHDGKLVDWVRPRAAGRRIRLTHANRRLDRLERMTEYFGTQGLSPETISALRDSADELLTHAFYEAPVAAGAEAKSIEPTRDVALPEDQPCNMVYGANEELAIVCVRDPFGALTRQRVIDDALSGSRFGRVFARAAIVAMSVRRNHYTEILVGIPKHETSPNAYAAHLFFREGARRGMWRLVDEDTGASHNTSVTLTGMD